MSDVEKIRKKGKSGKEREHEKAEENETSEIEKLTDDCLIEIFQHLTTVADKIRIERVCKKWRIVSQRSWNNFKSLDCSAKTWGMEEYRWDQRIIRSIDFDKIIRLSGRYLTSISTEVGKFVKICHLLPKILRLQLIDVCLDKNKLCELNSELSVNQRSSYETISQCTHETWQVILSWLMSHGENITNFQMFFDHSHYKEEDFASLLRKMKQLKSFYLYNSDFLHWMGTFLLELPFEIIQEIVFTSLSKQPFNTNLLFMMIQKCRKLQTLGIDLKGFKEREIVDLLQLHAASLKNLKLDLGFTWNTLWDPVILSTMTALTHIEKLDVSYFLSVDDEFLEVVVKNCKKLMYLNILGCQGVTDRGISIICNLEKLTYLNIGDLPKLRKPTLEKLTSLVVLVSSCNEELQDECFCDFLKKAHQLRAIHFGECFGVSKKILSVAIEVAQVRKSNNVLDIYVEFRNIDVGILDKKPPLLNVIDSIYVPLAKYGIEDPFNFEKIQVIYTS